MPLDALPVEILLQILSYLEPVDLTRLSIICRRLNTLCCDSKLWMLKCFETSHAERRRRHNMAFVASSYGEGRYSPLLRAVLDLAAPSRELTSSSREGHASVEMEVAKTRAAEKKRILANWDPEFPGEKINWREEYMQRHAEVVVGWFEGAGTTEKRRVNGERRQNEVTGVNLLYAQDDEVADKAIAAMEDGSISVWDVEEPSSRGRLLARSKPGLLTGFTSSPEEHDLERTRATMTETGAVECVSVDSSTQRAYFGVLNELVEVDLRTLQATSREQYPFPVTALSEARAPTPMTVGTNMTLHMYDPRDARRKVGQTPSLANKIELIAGSPRHGFSLLHRSLPQSHATLAQPGPLSILHLPEDRPWDGNGSIWVAGRFTSLLNYDRRFFPKLRGHLHSGARLSCLRSTPNPFLPREFGVMSTHAMSAVAVAAAKAIPGTTLLAAGEYKGKGSLELYGLSPDPARTSLSTDYAGARARNNSFLNRQTASSSKLLAVAPHGGKIAFADGDGNVRWVERNGFSPVRSWNLNGNDPTAAARRDIRIMGGPVTGLQEPPDDIVQLLIPTRPKATAAGRRADRFGEDNLIVWTGEGKLGMLGFGRPKWGGDDNGDLELAAERVEDAARRKEEVEYDVEMGMALRAHANELNFMKHLGFGAGGY